jgi:Mg2+ and Co2+ transporter CorA
MQTAFAYNGTQVKLGGTKEDIKKGFKLWLDLVNPSLTEISEVQKTFNLDESALETLTHKSKKPQVRVLENHKFTIILDIRYKTFKNLVTESIYLFHSTE